MRRVLHWLVDYWYIPVFILAAFGFWILTRGRGPHPMGSITTEIEAISAGARAREMAAKMGAAEATAAVQRVYQDRLQRLDEDQAKRAEELRHDPVALSRFLVRAAVPTTLPSERGGSP